MYGSVSIVLCKYNIFRFITMSAASLLQMSTMSGNSRPVAARTPGEESLNADLSALQGWEVNGWKAQLPMSTFLLFRPARFRKGLTPLHMMADLGKADAVESMLCAVDPGEVSRVASIQCEYDGQTALHYAAQNGHTTVVEALLAKLQPRDVVSRTRYEAWTALHLAAREGHEDTVKLLLGKMSREDVTARDSGLSGPSCLYAAVELGCTEAVERILQELGARFRVRQNTRAYGWEMLKSAVEGANGLELAESAIKASLSLMLAENPQETGRALRGLTALHWACKMGHLGVVKVLLEKMKDEEIAIRNQFEGRTALHMACLNQSEEIAEILIRRMRAEDLAIHETGMVMALATDVSEEEQNTESLLEIRSNVAAKLGQEGIWKEYGIRQRTALHMAAGYGMTNTVQLLLERLGPSAARTLDQLDGQTALHHAARGGHGKVVLSLLEKGGNDLLMIEDMKQRHTAIFYAMGKFCYESMKAKAADIKEDSTALLEEAKTCVKVFLERMTPEQVAQQNETGATIFHVAASARDDNAVEFILQYVNSKGLMVKDDGGRTALHWAAESGSVNMVSMILEKTRPANLTMKDEGDERTPLQIAAVPGYTDIVLLLASKMDIPALNTADASGSTALHIAVRNVHIEIVRGLCKLLPSPALAQQDLQKRIPLHYAVINFVGHSGLVARQTFADHSGTRHAHIAALQKEMVELFLRTIEDEALAIRDVQGKTVLHYAFEQKNTVMAKMFVDFFRKRNLMPRDKEGMAEVSGALTGDSGQLAEVLLRQVDGKTGSDLMTSMEELKL